jgi:putative transposase
VGHGHVYQGRFKSFPVEEDEYSYQVLRYIERNALRAALVERAEDWRWSSLSGWRSSEPDETWPLARPLPCGPGWSDPVNQPQTEGEVEAIQRAIRRGASLDSSTWVEATARSLGLESTLRPRFRPKQPAYNAIQDSYTSQYMRLSPLLTLSPAGPKQRCATASPLPVRRTS